LAGAILAGASVSFLNAGLLLLAMSLAYIGGMFLNDAYDHKIDAVERPERPIPSGDISVSMVYGMGYALLGICVVLVIINTELTSTSLSYAVLSVMALIASIVVYNIWHKENPLSPFIMGLCRMFVYITTGYSLMPEPAADLFIAALVTLSYLIGLTYIAKKENDNRFSSLWPIAFLVAPVIFGLVHSPSSPPTLLFTALFAIWLLYSLQFLLNSAKRNVPKSVISMIAGISLVDAIYVSAMGVPILGIAALVMFALTLFLQRYVAGT